ncbi:Urea carboxylase [Granulibacter bethesdensis]|uniref:Urea carboxylase n=2 Tax=Granulibacter bethesdensis TaxID=364410 RepID=A0AAN0VG91_9PROT|nr:Urea carboxylase [Granulibacter bethesdensis]APH57585.1 Urea carboxylase [Granulibacter bethesdensis]
MPTTPRPSKWWCGTRPDEKGFSMFDHVLVANRGAIACRIFRTLKKMGVGTVAVYSEADRHSRHRLMADQSVCVGPAQVSGSYLDIEAIIAACKQTGAQAVHPGYGFLSENAAFANRLAEEGIRFIGPSPEHMRIFGLKHTAREAAQACGVPLLPGTGLLPDLQAAHQAATQIGYPVMIKSTAGGGGIGLQLCRSADELGPLFETVRRLSESNFKDGGIYLEKYVARARHIEVQIFGDGQGHVVALGERDCSLQRRNQKVVEETPAPNLPAATRAAMMDAAIRLGCHVAYESAGTVEFIYDDEADQFYFLEVNTRLQVEHGVTEQVTGVDLVEWMVRQAAGELSGLKAPMPHGASIQVRLYAEDPGKGFLPSSGRLTHVAFPADDVRVDSWIESGTEVTPYYDPMLAKIIVTGQDRAEALSKLQDALAHTSVYGIETNLDYLATIAASGMLSSGKVSTRALGDFPYQPSTIDVLAPGAQSSLQDWPGRLGYWDVGVPPSGPMDALSHRLVNRLLGNPSEAATLEITLTGPTLRFNAPTEIALGGAEMDVTLDGQPVPFWQVIRVEAGQVLTIAAARQAGNRAYLAVRHGFDAPVYMGSRATFALGRFGGHGVGCLRTGDVLRLNRSGAGPVHEAPLDPTLRPALTRDWRIGVLVGPHGAPDFFTETDIATLFEAEYEVHFNSARTGVRLIGPKPDWARTDGGEAGLHPSNIHDNAYAVGALDFTGDMPIILGPDGPSLGGFVCPVTVACAELWKIGQLKPGDKLSFVRLDIDQADALRHAQDAALKTLHAVTAPALAPPALESPVLARFREGNEAVLLRQSGDDNLLVEFGPLELDLSLRFQAHALMERLKADNLPGLLDLTPGIRSLQVHLDPDRLPIGRMRGLLAEAIADLPPVDQISVPTRTIHMPLSWDDESTRLAIRKYQDLVRPDAPWCPSNIEFIRRINGLADEQAVKDVVYNARYLVLGLGDVYLGAPVATPLDPRHRLVTTKYNPARTWTPENAVGIGGAYMCIYGMEGPGGYQFVGRTVQVWNTHRQTANFRDGKPWLLRFFDQIRFFPVSAQELAEARDAFPYGGYALKTEESVFRLADYHRFLAENADSIAAFKSRQQTAFEAERQRWRELGLAAYVSEDDAAAPPEDVSVLPPGVMTVDSPIPGNVWKVLVETGHKVQPGQAVAILESMKMEMEVKASVSGVVREVLCQTGKTVQAGQRLLLIEEEA